jgi:hypothetical protein
MSDIVWSLRNDVPCNGDIGCAQELCEKAAAEIERLRAENERLRAALGKVAIGNGDPQFTACAALGFENGL